MSTGFSPLRGSVVEPGLERLEHALSAVAYLVLEHGEQYAPLMERLEADIVQERKRMGVGHRAEQILTRAALEITHAPRR